MRDKTSGFARYLQAHDYSPISYYLHLQIQTATFHITAASKSFNERDSAIVVSQIESRYPMSKLQKQNKFQLFPFRFSRKCITKVTRKRNWPAPCFRTTRSFRVQPKLRENIREILKAMNNSRCSMQTAESPVKLKSHREAISQKFLSILISWTYL